MLDTEHLQATARFAMGQVKADTQYLSGWKEIAAYLGKGVRTVQRYEREFRLPVRRPSGHSHGAVIAARIELDEWVNAAPLRHASL